MGRGTKRCAGNEAEVPAAKVQPRGFLHIQHCWQSTTSSAVVFPWNATFINAAERQLRVQPVPGPKGCLAPIPKFNRRPAADSLSAVEELTASAFSMAGLKLSTESGSWEQKLDSDRKAALRKWLVLMKLEPAAWELGRQVAQSAGQMRLMDSLADALASKPTAPACWAADEIL